MDENILTECHTDTLLIQLIAPPTRNGYNHQKSCTKVLSIMKDKLEQQFALGIIDDDKKKPKDFINNFRLIKRQNEHLSIYKHNNKPHYIITNGKAIEDFILAASQENNINLADYNIIPNNLEGLRRKTKDEDAIHDNDLRRLISDIRNTTNFSKLREWIKLIKNSPYTNFSEDLF
jgi:hypothetical protein